MNTAIGAGLVTCSAPAAVTVTSSYTAWETLAGPSITHLTFADFGGFADIPFTTQYAALGVTDPEPNDWIVFTFNAPDHYALGGVQPPFTGNPDTITLDFAAPIYGAGYSYYFQPSVDLFLDGTPVVMGVTMPTMTALGFGGFNSTQPFNRIVFHKAPGQNAASMDDFWFQSIPSPGATCLLVASALWCGRRRR